MSLAVPIRTPLTANPPLAGHWNDAEKKLLTCNCQLSALEVAKHNYEGGIISAFSLPYPKDMLDFITKASFHPTLPLLAAKTNTAIYQWNYESKKLLSINKFKGKNIQPNIFWHPTKPEPMIIDTNGCVFEIAKNRMVRTPYKFPAQTNDFIIFPTFEASQQRNRLTITTKGKYNYYANVLAIGAKQNSESIYMLRKDPTIEGCTLELLEHGKKPTVLTELELYNSSLTTPSLINKGNKIFISTLGTLLVFDLHGQELANYERINASRPIITPSGSIFYGLNENVNRGGVNCSIILFEPPRGNTLETLPQDPQLETDLELE